MKKLFENILNESSGKGPELQFIVSSYVPNPNSKREKWRVEEDEKFDKAIGIGQDIRFRLSELKDLIYSLPDKIIEYRNETEKYDAIKHECFFKGIRTGLYEDVIIVRYNTKSIYSDTRSEGYIELYISLDYNSFEKYLTE